MMNFREKLDALKIEAYNLSKTMRQHSEKIQLIQKRLIDINNQVEQLENTPPPIPCTMTDDQ